ncbi:MAG: DUF1707 domain-containing protein [Nocardiopsaceae bacterium]|nr:DUF1707 domain-containing protein [Nocardiopsaceae bacterium]
MRASDADRDTTAQRLSTALSEGRLTLDEYNLRLDSAMRAATIGELVPLTSDLPEPDRPQDGPVDLAEVADTDSSPSPWKKWFDEWRWWLGGAVIMIGIWGTTSIADGELRPFWPLIPLGIWAAVLIADLFFPDKDDD